MLLLRLELVLCINLCYNSLCVKCVLIVNIFNIVSEYNGQIRCPIRHFFVRFDISGPIRHSVLPNVVMLE